MRSWAGRSTPPVPPSLSEPSEHKELVDGALDALDYDKRAVLLLHDVDGRRCPTSREASGSRRGRSTRACVRRGRSSPRRFAA